MAFRRRTEPDTIGGLYEYALGALGRRMRSVAEMKRLLRQRVVGAPAAETMVQVVVDKLKEQRLLNDTEYASSYTSLRREDEMFGRQRIVADLKRKGVHGDIIEKTVSEAFSGVDEEKQARAYLARKRVAKPADPKQAARVFRLLRRAGFGTRTILGILKHWDVDDELLAALEGEAIEGGEGDGGESGGGESI
jgi:regulatory protein